MRQKVISLHERKGHANTEAMCDALAGEAPAWTPTDVTPLAHDGSTMYFLFADVRTGYLLAYNLAMSRAHFLKRLSRPPNNFAGVTRSKISDPKDGKMGSYLRENNLIYEMSTPEAYYRNFVER